MQVDGNKKKTDMKAIRDIAKCFLYVDIQETQFPFIASHPFTNNWITLLGSTEGHNKNNDELVDLHDEENLKKWRKMIEERIDKDNLTYILMMMNKPYILNFLEFAEQYISDEDLGTVLNNFWQHIEQISLNNSNRMLLKLFKRADKNTLMQDEERLIFNNLPEQVTIYRGVTNYNKRNKKALSWTLDREQAEWFANRYNTGTGEVWTMTVPKERILCCFEGREKEVIVNLYRLKDKDILIENLKK